MTGQLVFHYGSVHAFISPRERKLCGNPDGHLIGVDTRTHPGRYTRHVCLSPTRDTHWLTGWRLPVNLLLIYSLFSMFQNFLSFVLYFFLYFWYFIKCFQWFIKVSYGFMRKICIISTMVNLVLALTSSLCNFLALIWTLNILTCNKKQRSFDIILWLIFSLVRLQIYKFELSWNRARRGHSHRESSAHCGPRGYPWAVWGISFLQYYGALTYCFLADAWGI